MSVTNNNVIIAKFIVLTIFFIWIIYFYSFINDENLKYDLILNNNSWIILAQIITLISIIKQTYYLLLYHQELIDKINRLR